jgi:transcriptional regulator of heat shock response
MITASRIAELAMVLTPEMIERIKGVLAASNIEHRDLAVSTLLEDTLALEEDQVEDLLKRLRQRLLAAFDQAKKDTAGKKRIRFLLK